MVFKAPDQTMNDIFLEWHVKDGSLDNRIKKNVCFIFDQYLSVQLNVCYSSINIADKDPFLNQSLCIHQSLSKTVRSSLYL
jgi:hypothetical protein